jgi:hypothetical protein
LQSFDTGTLVVRLPEENHSLHEIQEVLRLEKYLRRKNSVNNPENIQKILDDMGREITTRKGRIATLLEEEVAGAELFAGGGKFKPYLANDEDGMFAELRTAVQEEIENLNDFLGRYKSQEYPGKGPVDQGLKLLKEIISCKDATSFFQELKTRKESLLAWLEAITPVRGFFQNQVSKYDEARKHLAYYQNNHDYVPWKRLRLSWEIYPGSWSPRNRTA